MNTSTNAGSHFRGTSIGGVPMPRKGGKAPAGNSPKTASKPTMRPVANVLSDQSNTSRNAEQQIKRPPQPFQTKQGPAMMPAGTMREKGLGDGKSKNGNGLITGAKPTIAATGNVVPGGNSKVVGGQKGLSHPSKKGDVTMGTKAHRNAAFYGGSR